MDEFEANAMKVKFDTACARVEETRTLLEGYTEERDDLIRTAHAQGWSLRKIAGEAGVSFARVAQIINQGDKT